MRAWQPSLSSLLWFRRIGMRLAGGFRKPCASTTTRVRGTRTLATATTAGCNFYLALGARWVALRGPIWLPLASSSTGHGSSTSVTVTPFVSGEPPAGAGSAEVSA